MSKSSVPKVILKYPEHLKIQVLDQSRQKKNKKKGKLLLSHRYNPLPLLRSHPGGVQEELVVKDLPRHKDIQKVDMG